MSLKKQLIKSFMSVGIMKLLSIPVGLVTSIILARTLGPEGFGQYAFIMALVPLIALPVSGGLPQLLTREVATFAHAKNWALYQGALRASHAWVLLIAAILLIGYWVLRAGFNLVPTEGKWALLPIALLMVPLGGLAAVRTGTIKGLGLPAYAELPGQMIKPVVMLVLFAILAWQGALDTEAAIWSQVAGAGLIFLIASWMFFRIQPKESKGIHSEYNLKVWGKGLFPFSILAMVGTFNSQVGIIFLGILSADEQIAAMRVAERAGQFVTMPLSIINMIIAPYIVRCYKDGNMDLLQKLSRKTARVALFLSLPVATCFLLYGDLLINLAFGKEYAQIALAPVVIITLGQLFNVAFGSVGFLLAMTGYEKESLKGQVLSIIISIALSVALIPKFGAVGAAVAVSVGIVFWNIFLGYKVFSKIGIKPSAI